MKRIDKIINNKANLGIDFIVHIQNKAEFDELVQVLTNNGFDIQFCLTPDISLKSWMETIAREYDYDTCFRIRNRINDKSVAYNPSVEHWRKFCNDILEIRNGELEFNEGKYTLKTAKIESEKIWHELQDNKNVALNLFGFPQNITKEEVFQWLMNK